MLCIGMTNPKDDEARVRKAKVANMINKLVGEKGMQPVDAAKAAEAFFSKKNPDKPKDPFGKIPG